MILSQSGRSSLCLFGGREGAIVVSFAVRLSIFTSTQLILTRSRSSLNLFHPSQGKVHNPSGQGVAAFSAGKKKVEKTTTDAHHHSQKQDDHETKKIEEGSSRRNITRKKTDPAATGRYDSRNKKQGGAGKGKWLKDGSDLDLGMDEPLDENDPLYVAEEDADPSSYVLSSHETADELRHSGAGPNAYDADNDKAVYGPMLTLAEFKIRVSDAVREYFDSSDADEVVRCIDEMKCREYHPEVVKRAIILGLDAGPRERELICRLLACLHPNPLSDECMELGFEVLLDSIDDLVIDIPDARAMVGSFLARAVVDEVVAPAFLSNRNNNHPGDCVVEKAVTLLSREHCIARLEKVWGPGDGRPVSELKNAMDQLLKVRRIDKLISLHVTLTRFTFKANIMSVAAIFRRNICSLVNSMRPQAASASSTPNTSTMNS
jgi:hypothetical protein